MSDPNEPWRPPVGSNNTTNKCWLNAPLYALLSNKYIREKNKFNDTTCVYAGYICPHPLKQLMIVRITLEDVTEEKTVISFFEANCKDIIDTLSNIKINWNKFSIENNIS